MLKTACMPVCIAIACCLFASPVAGDEITVGAVTVYSGPDVERFVVHRDGVNYIAFPGGRMWALTGGGATFFPMPPEEVVEAIGAIEYPLEGIESHVLILPVPRRDLTPSSAEGFVIYLTPGRLQYPKEHVHYTVTHEIGHVVQHLLMPDCRSDLWTRYRNLRGIGIGNPESDFHAGRLHEIFAEDFRVLFGGSYARCGGQVENHDLVPPHEIDGLKEFFVSLIDEWRDVVRVCAYPNPFQTGLVLGSIGVDQTLEIQEVMIYDVSGRVLRVIRPQGPAHHKVVWDGSDRYGRPVAPGLYITKLITPDRVFTHKIIRLPE
jgi:hypothetical protein